MTAFNIGFLIFPDITQLDFTGPLEVFSRLSTPSSAAAPTEFPQSKTHIVGKSALPVPSDRGHSFLPKALMVQRNEKARCEIREGIEQLGTFGPSQTSQAPASRARH